MVTVVVGVLAAVLAGALVVASARHRRLRDRLARLVTLGDGLESSADADPLERVERALETTRDEIERASRDRVRLAAALAEHGDAVIVVNRLGEPVLGNEAGTMLGPDRHAAAVARDAIEELLDAALQGAPGERELPLFGPPKRVLYLWARPLRDGSGVLGAVAFVRDISEARRVESVRRDFVANVSHELKTPVGALALLAETMAADPDPVVVGQLADRVLHEADRLGRIVDDLLDLSLIEAQEAPSREPVPVHLLLGEAYELVRAAAEAVDVPVEIGPVSTDLELTCDRRQVVSAIRNLLDNAVKYSEPGGVVELSAAAEGDVVTLQVRDHGIGIPRRDLERIFERFYRVDRARSRETGGTGLGLSIVRHVAHAHGGDVSVDSVEGEGSVFRLRVPRARGGARRLSEAS